MVSHSFLLFFFLRPIQAGPVLAQQTFCFSAKGILEHDSHNQCAKHCSHRLQPGICGPKLFSPANKRNTNKQHKQQYNDGNVGPAVAFTSFDFGPYLSKRTGADIPDKSSGKRVQHIHIHYDGLGFIPLNELMKEETA